VIPISYGLWVVDKEACIAKIAEKLDVSLLNVPAKEKV
jgi:hypothetical protein